MAERRYQLVFYVAVIVGAMAAYGVYRVLEATKANSRIATAPVVVANQDMPEGTSVARSSVSTKPWPVQTIPAGAYSSIDSVVGRVTRIQVFKGEPMLPGRMAPAGTGPGLEVKISPGKRAMAVRINDVAGISGLIQPNSRVDVLVTIRDDDASHARHVAKLFMENMRVLSVGPRVQRVDDDDKGPGASNATTATLEVTPDEAERLAVAMNQGTIQLVLRGYGDPDSIKTNGATSTDVLAQLRQGRTVEVPTPTPEPKPRRAPVERFKPPAEQPVVIAPPPPPPIRRPDSSTVQVYRAGKMSQQRFEKGDSTAKKGDSTSTSQTSSP